MKKQLCNCTVIYESVLERSHMCNASSLELNFFLKVNSANRMTSANNYGVWLCITDFVSANDTFAAVRKTDPYMLQSMDVYSNVLYLHDDVVRSSAPLI